MSITLKSDIDRLINQSDQLVSMQTAIVDAISYSVNDPMEYHGAIIMMESLLIEHSKQLRNLLNKM